MTPAPSIADIRLAADRLRGCSSKGLSRVARALEAIADGDDPATALGIRPAPGQRSHGTKMRVARRDELIRALRDRHYRRLSDREAGKAIARDWTRYAATAAIHHDRELGAWPKYGPSQPETLRDFLRAIALLPGAVPSADRTARICSGCVTSYPLFVTQAGADCAASKGEIQNGIETARFG